MKYKYFIQKYPENPNYNKKSYYYDGYEINTNIRFFTPKKKSKNAHLVYERIRI